MERRRLDHWEVLAWLLPGVAILVAAMATVDLAYLIQLGDRISAATRSSARRVDLHGRGRAVDQPIVGCLDRAERDPFWIGVERPRGVPRDHRLRLRRRHLPAHAARGGGSVVAGCLVMGGFLCVATLPGALALRPQLLVAPLFVLTCWLLDPPRRSSAAVWAIVPVAIVWANLHGSFILVPLLVAIAAIGIASDGARTHGASSPSSPRRAPLRSCRRGARRRTRTSPM